MCKSVVRHKLQGSGCREYISISISMFMSYLKATLRPSSFWFSGLVPLCLTCWINILLIKQHWDPCQFPWKHYLVQTKGKKSEFESAFVTKCKRGGIDTKRVNSIFTVPMKLLAWKQGMQKLLSARTVGT